MVLDVSDLTVPSEHGGVAVHDLSFEVRAGEILGIAGVQGNGQTELCEALIGLRPSTGTVSLDGQDISHLSHQGPAAGRASATSPRTGRKTAWSATSRSPRT